MVRRAVEDATRGARVTAAVAERERVCSVLATYAEITDHDATREILWEVIGHVLDREVAS